MSDSKLFGLKDIPICNYENEFLGLTEYAEALTEFVNNCDTPITIALQGDWGSGKTSLMNLIRLKLDDVPGVESIWFNTWQYSQFGQSENLAISMISNFIDEVCQDDANKRNLKKTLWQTAGKWGGRIAKAGAVAAGSLIGQADTVKESYAIIAGEEEKKSEIERDPATLIKELKSQLENSVENRKQQNAVNRIVVFIDDLDRLIPIKAVELLEALKLFLDLDGCVFVLACDYHVVIQGLKEKFKVTEEELKGKSFFDKIIQLPFNMPVSQYKVEVYFRALLEKIKVDFSPKDLPLYMDLVNYSVGFNPRSMKRLFNSLLLLRIVSEKKFKDYELQSTSTEKMRMLFGILCMQNAYEALYKYLVANDISDELFAQLKDLRIDQDNEDNKSLIYLIKELSLENDESKLMRFRGFIDTFYKTIQLDSDSDAAKLNQTEIDNLEAILTFSSVVSTETTSQSLNLNERYANRGIAKNVLDALNGIYGEQLNKIHLQANLFRLYQERSKEAADACIFLTVHADEKRYFHINWIVGITKMRLSFTCPKTYISHFTSWVKCNLSEILPELSFTNIERFAFSEKRVPDSVTAEQKEELFRNWTRETAEKILPVIEREFAKKT